jgi:Tol biopolymer transport system component/DNA-binding winged helix-turn-helix (wHTH) protein
MSGNRPVQVTIRFGAFEADLRTQELRKLGVRLRLPGQSFQILRMLLERPGELITREELHEALWPSDTFVDFEHGVHAAVSRLREAVSDSADSPYLIETLPKRGYRFIGKITETAPIRAVPDKSASFTDVQDIPRGANERASKHRNWLRVGAWVLAFAGCGMAAMFIRLRSRPHIESETLTPVRFSTFQGGQSFPSFSPDGKMIAFAAKETGNDEGLDLYVKVVGHERPLQLTHQPADMIAPAWSPDGRYIAFSRLSKSDSSIYLIPALGGVERKLAQTNFNYWLSLKISWSPDGKYIAFSDRDENSESRLFLLSVDSLEKRKLDLGPTKCLWYFEPAISPDGSTIAFDCIVSYGISDLRLLPVAGGESRLVRRIQGGIEGMAWLPDGRSLIYSNRGALWELSALGGDPVKLPFGEDTEDPVTPRNGSRLAFARVYQNYSIWRATLSTEGIVREKPMMLITSSRVQSGPEFSPSGTKIAFVSDRSGEGEIWICDRDGSNPVQLTSSVVGSWTEGEHWSPDGQKIVFTSNVVAEGGGRLFIVDVAERVPKAIETGTFDNSRPFWSHNGLWILFTSHTTGTNQVWKIPAAGGKAIQVTENGGMFPIESPDGRLIYYAKQGDTTRIWQVPTQGGAELPVRGMPIVRYARDIVVATDGIYFVDQISPRPGIDFFAFKSQRVSRILDVKNPAPWNCGLSLSPDRRQLLYTQVDRSFSEIMLVDHFR